MKAKELNIKYKEFSFDELNSSDKKLIGFAVESAKNAYAPYSKFRVGAAVLLSDGTIIKGNNQENAAYPSGLCAERVAVFFANANYPDKAIDTLVVLSIDESGNIIEQNASPCGSCRQVIAETEMKYNNSIRILLVSQKTVLEFNSINDLLPFSFGKDNLS
ncbi:MAG: cytidine deaminase [Bacteroidales bacterium]|jgi:cytidine deaminase|nr:cytidine deaminase [Bacteroidales bacterium]